MQWTLWLIYINANYTNRGYIKAIIEFLKTMNAPQTKAHTDSHYLAPVPERIIKRNLEDMAFDPERLYRTLTTIRKQHREFSKDKQAQLQAQILRHLKHHQGGAPAPSVLQLQDAIEHSLLSNAYYKSAKSFIAHRAEKRMLRLQRQRLKLLIQAIHAEINKKPAATDKENSRETNPTNLCLSLFAQMIHQTPDSLTERPELSEELKEHIRLLSSDNLVDLLRRVEEIIGWDIQP